MRESTLLFQPRSPTKRKKKKERKKRSLRERENAKKKLENGYDELF
jgi:hypothetical protein